MDYKILTYKETIERLKLWETDKNTNREEWIYKIGENRRGAVDNTTGDFWMEGFKTKQEAVDYLDMKEGREALIS